MPYIIYIFLLFNFSNKLPVCVCVYSYATFSHFIQLPLSFYLTQTLYTKNILLSTLFSNKFYPKIKKGIISSFTRKLCHTTLFEQLSKYFFYFAFKLFLSIICKTNYFNIICLLFHLICQI